MGKQSRRREEKRAARKRERDIEKLIKQGARHIADAGQLVRYQMSMLARFASGDVPMERWRDLKRCRAGRCSSTSCSAACWFGDRGKVNDLILAAARVLRGSEKTLHFVTIIDPHYAAPAGQLASVSINGILSSLRRRFREAGDLFEGDPAFGFVEAAMEMLPDSQFVWFVHVHLVLASDASRKQVRDALRPPRDMPDPQEWGRKRWKPIVVKPVSGLTNLLAYFGKRLPEANRMQVSEQDERSRWPARLRPEHHLEYDLWLLAQRPSDRIFKRGMKEVHGKLMEMPPKA